MISKGFCLVVLLTILQSGKCEDYLVVVAYRGKGAYIRYTAGETGGLVEIQYPHLYYRNSNQLPSFSSSFHRVSDKMQITHSLENSAIVVSGSAEDINILVDADGVFSPLPISALGTKYMLSSSLDSTSSYQCFVLIAAHNTSTTIDYGDRLSFKLNPYQTLKLSCDLTETVITSENSIAVYSGMDYDFKYTVYDQLLPVKHYGQEYVVAVDDFKLDLQLTSEHSHVQITFSSGATVSTGERRLYNRSLERGESLHFTATRPVLVTLSRADDYSSAFTTVPPVHSYVTQRVIWLYYNNLRVKLKILTDRRATVFIKDKDVNDLLTWVDVAGSRYKVGTLVQSQSRSIDSTFIFSDLPFTVLSFYNGSVYDIGFNLPAEETVHYTGQSYLVALTVHMNNYSIFASAGETGGQWQVQDPHSGRIWSRRFNPYNTDVFYPNTATTSLVLLYMEDDAIQIRGRVNSFTSFTPLPVSALGSKYIMFSCLTSNESISVLVIATHSKMADIDIIFRLDSNATFDGMTYIDGDTLSIRLDRYQTFFLNSSSDMTGTIVNATETIAVYSGTYNVRETIFTTFEQLLPVKHYGHEYILAIQDLYSIYQNNESATSYQLQVVTDYSDTRIMFINGSSISMGEDGLYRKQLGNLETVYFNTTRPVMATLCSIERYYFSGGSVVVPPVSLYSKLTTQQTRGTLQILTDQENNNVDIQYSLISLSIVLSYPAKWKNVSGTRFKVGTVFGGGYTTTIRSNFPFAVLGYDKYAIYNGGYSFRTNPDTETSTPDGSSTQFNTLGAFQADSSNNSAVIVGAVCGIVIVALLVAFMAYVFYIRRTTIPVKKATGQTANIPSVHMNIYAVPDRVAGAATGENTYAELRFNSTHQRHQHQRQY